MKRITFLVVSLVLIVFLEPLPANATNPLLPLQVVSAPRIIVKSEGKSPSSAELNITSVSYTNAIYINPNTQAEDRSFHWIQFLVCPTLSTSLDGCLAGPQDSGPDLIPWLNQWKSGAPKYIVMREHVYIPAPNGNGRSFILESNRVAYAGTPKLNTTSSVEYPASLDIFTSLDGETYQWFECSKEQKSFSEKLAPGCKAVANANARTLTLGSQFTGKYLLLQIKGKVNYFTASTAKISKIKLPVTPEVQGEALVGQNVTAEISVQKKIGYQEWNPQSSSFFELFKIYQCPLVVKAKVKSIETGLTRILSVPVVPSGDECLGSVSFSPKANSLLTVESIATSETSTSTSVTKKIIVTPKIKAKVPSRAFGFYKLTVSSKSRVTTKCYVTEEFFSFGGGFLRRKTFSINMVKGVVHVYRKVEKIGHIYGSISCKANAKFGSSEANFELTSF
jgi:hypothetical protein